MIKRFVLLTALTAAGCLTPLASTLAQQDATGQGPTGNAPGASRERSQTDTRQDTHFIQKAAEGGLAEVELGRLAEQNAASDAVKQFGERMVLDHSKANNQLMQIAQQHGITPPAQLSDKHKALRDKLAALKGQEFDREYMSAMIDDHKEDISNFEQAAKTAQAKDVQQFAQQTLPTLREHLKLAQSIEARLGK